MSSKRTFGFYSSGKRSRRTATPQAPAFDPSNGPKSEETKEKRAHPVDPPVDSLTDAPKTIINVRRPTKSTYHPTDGRIAGDNSAHLPSNRRSPGPNVPSSALHPRRPANQRTIHPTDVLSI